MWTRWLSVVAALWTAGYVVVYLTLVDRDGDSPAWWYVAVLVVSVVPLIAAAVGRSSRSALMLSALALAIAMVLGLLSIGLILLPAVVCAGVAAFVMKPASRGASALP